VVGLVRLSACPITFGGEMWKRCINHQVRVHEPVAVDAVVPLGVARRLGPAGRSERDRPPDDMRGRRGGPGRGGEEECEPDHVL